MSNLLPHIGYRKKRSDAEVIARLNAIIHNQREEIRHLQFVVQQLRRAANPHTPPAPPSTSRPTSGA